MWPFRRRKTPEGIVTAQEILADTEATDRAVDAVHDEHVRRLRENNFAPKIAAALHLRRVR